MCEILSQKVIVIFAVAVRPDYLKYQLLRPAISALKHLNVPNGQYVNTNITSLQVQII